MTLIEHLPDAVWTEKGGVCWTDGKPESVRDIAKAMQLNHARFITITAHQLRGTTGFRLEYHWDLEGQLFGFAFEIAGNSVESIYDICEAADWIESEIYEGFAIEFTGRTYKPLQLRAGLKPGVNLREEVSR